MLTIIGAGPGGYVAAIRAAQLGARVTVVEAAEVGGTCLNKGCIPTKTLIASAEMLNRVRDAADFGIDIPGLLAVNLDRIRERKDKVVVDSGQRAFGACSKAGEWNWSKAAASLLSAAARSVSQNGRLEQRDSNRDRIIIATGSRPARIPGFPFDGSTVMTSDDAVQLRKVPAQAAHSRCRRDRLANSLSSTGHSAQKSPSLK